MTQQIINTANQVIRNAAFTKLVKTGRGSKSAFLIVNTKDFALYGSYSSNSIYAIDNLGSTYRLA